MLGILIELIVFSVIAKNVAIQACCMLSKANLPIIMLYLSCFLKILNLELYVFFPAGPKSPMDLKYEEERRLFIWTAERIAYDYEMKDVVQVAEVFQETENREHEFKELGSTTMYLVRRHQYQ